MKKTILLLLAACIPMSAAFADKGRGGADAVVCENYFIDHTTLPDLKGIYGPAYGFIGGQKLYDLALEQLSLSQPTESAQVKGALRRLTFIPVPGELPLLDTGVKVSLASAVFKGCKKFQLATQKDGVVTYSTSAFNRLSEVEQYFFKIHEAYIFIALNEGKNLKAAETYARTKVAELYSDPGLDALVRKYRQTLGDIPGVDLHESNRAQTLGYDYFLALVFVNEYLGKNTYWEFNGDPSKYVVHQGWVARPDDNLYGDFHYFARKRLPEISNNKCRYVGHEFKQDNFYFTLRDMVIFVATHIQCSYGLDVPTQIYGNVIPARPSKEHKF